MAQTARVYGRPCDLYPLSILRWFQAYRRGWMTCHPYVALRLIYLRAALDRGRRTSRPCHVLLTSRRDPLRTWLRLLVLYRISRRIENH